MKNKLLALAALASLVSVPSSRGIENLRISVVGSNAVLSWPSVTNEAFMV